jgi:hypothetical protein
MYFWKYWKVGCSFCNCFQVLYFDYKLSAKTSGLEIVGNDKVLFTLIMSWPHNCYCFLYRFLSSEPYWNL